MISYWGIDHGDVVSKADFNGQKKPTVGRYASAYLTGGLHGAVAGKKGSKLRATGNEVGGQTIGSFGGQAAGLGVSALSRGKIKPQAVTPVTGMAGAVTGSVMGVNRNQRKGYLKPQR